MSNDHRGAAHAAWPQRALCAALLAIMVAVPARGQAKPAASPMGDLPATAGAEAGSLAGAEATAEVKLASERWREHSYGISLLPPAVAELTPLTHRGLLRIAEDGLYTIVLDIRRMGGPVELAELRRVVMGRVDFSNPSAARLVSEKIQAVNRPVHLEICMAPGPDHQAWVLGFAFMQIDPIAYVVLEMETTVAAWEQATQVLRAVASSLRVASPEELDEQREELFEAGRAWRAQVIPDGLTAAVERDLWMRIVEDGKDVGYVRIEQRMVPADAQRSQPPGVRVDLEHMIERDGQQRLEQHEMFASLDGTYELWSIRSQHTAVGAQAPQGAARPGSRRTAQPWQMLWTESGVHDMMQGIPHTEKIAVHRSMALLDPQAGETSGRRQSADSGEADVRVWEVRPARPPLPRGMEYDEPDPQQKDLNFFRSYLPLAWQYMSGAMLRGRDDFMMAHYAYFPREQRMTLRVDRVEAQPDGGYRVHTRVAPELPEQTAVYNAEGRLLLVLLPGGRQWVRSTQAEIERRWGSRQTSAAAGQGAAR